MSAPSASAEIGTHAMSPPPTGRTLAATLRAGLSWLDRMRGLHGARAGEAATVTPLSDPTDAMIRVDSGGRAERRPATIIGAPPALAEEFAARAITPIVPPATAIVTIDRAITAGGVVERADGSIVAESLLNMETLDVIGPYARDASGRFARRRAPRPRRRLADRPHVMLKQHWDANYGHWLVEGLPRLALVEDHFRLADLGFIVSAHHGAMQQIYEESLALFGIRRDRIVEVGTEEVAVDRLIYPAPMTCHPWQIAPRCVAVLEELATRVRSGARPFERIYVSRNGATCRRLLNEDEIVARVERHGFTVVAPENLSLYRQIGLFRDARLIVGNYGAALTNAAFATSDVTLFALTSEYMQDDFFATLMSLKRGRYVSLHGTALDPAKGNASDFTIDADAFERMLTPLL